MQGGSGPMCPLRELCGNREKSASEGSGLVQIAVCVKQVPDTADIRIHPETNTLIRDGVDAILNPFDAHAIEEALCLRERLGGTVTALTMGPLQSEAVLRQALAMGVDDAVLLTDRAFAGADTWATSLTLATALKQLNAKIILCGKQAIDGDTAQVGPAIAAHLGFSQVSYLTEILEAKDDRLTVERLLDHGRETLHVPVPTVLTVVRELNNPRVSTLQALRQSRGKSITSMTVQDLLLDPETTGLPGSPTAVREIFSPEVHGHAQMLHAATVQKTVSLLLRRLGQLPAEDRP